MVLYAVKALASSCSNRLRNAGADQRSIYAVIRGGAVNNDGRSAALWSRPVVRDNGKCCKLHGNPPAIEPQDLRYIEMHGTGTSVGDPVEISGGWDCSGQKPESQQPCALGSIKTNIGHTESAAGVAGLMKARADR